MTQKDFWPDAQKNVTIAVIGGGTWGTVLANLAARNCREVRLWLRDEGVARAINATRVNREYLPELTLHERVHAMTDVERVFGVGEAEGAGGVSVVIWALPSGVTREQARRLAPYFRGDELVIHVTKGVIEAPDPETDAATTLKRVSEVLLEELPCPRVGVMSGPNLASEIARGEPAATVVASVFDEVIEAGQALFATDAFRIYSARDVIGVEWAGVLKNVLAIAAGALDAMKLGWNARAMLITRGLAEMVRFGVAMGARESTFLGLAGIGDLLATCSSPLSRNYRVGNRLAQGEKLADVLASMGETAEGVRTTHAVWAFARSRGISMPITEAVHTLLSGEGAGGDVAAMIRSLMSRPPANESK
jgi:glycerol-3-phosphate dehydrogenase (NAD(P)+)